MAAQKGLDLLIKIGDGEATETFNAFGGIRTSNISFNAETVDITNINSTNRWRELLAGAGVQSCSISGSGVFLDDARDEEARDYFFGGTIPNMEIIIPDFGTVAGPFQITTLDYSAEHNGEVSWSISLESAGALTYTAA